MEQRNSSVFLYSRRTISSRRDTGRNQQTEYALLFSIYEKNGLVGREVLQPYEIRIKELDSFVLRTREALNKCKKKTIKLARMRDIKLELLRSQKLEGYFASNPREKDLLARNEQPVALRLHTTAIADVPEYMGQFSSFLSQQIKRFSAENPPRDGLFERAEAERKEGNEAQKEGLLDQPEEVQSPEERSAPFV